MTATSTHITLVHAGERLDVSALTGTTVGALLSSQTERLGTHSPSVTTTDGGQVGGSALLGTDVPEGSVLVIDQDTGPGGGLEGVRAAMARQTLRGTPMTLSMTILVALLVLLLGGLPMVLGWSVLLPSPARAAGAALIALLAACAPRHAGAGSPAREAAGCLTLPALGAAGAVLLVPSDLTDLSMVTVLAAAWGATVTAVLLWLVRRDIGTAVSAWAWVLLAFLVTAVYALSLPVRPVLLVVTALGALGGLLVPRLSMRVPDNQLLDMEPLRVVGRSVREQRPPRAVRVTRGRVGRTVREAAIASVALELVLAAMAVAGSLTLLRVSLTSGVPAWGARVELVCVLALLLLRPRGTHSRTLRLIPRLAVAAMLTEALVVTCLPDPQAALVTGSSVSLTAGILVAVAGISLGMGVLLSTRPSAWWGRAGDIAQGLAALSVLPSAVVAAGLIDVMRQI